MTKECGYINVESPYVHARRARGIFLNIKNYFGLRQARGFVKNTPHNPYTNTKSLAKEFSKIRSLYLSILDIWR